ncbi:MAG: SpoIID/LytB domain-containing protein [Acidobacteria bacterium]|nr:SpoIID/LytB domain-containing protein [Acidobacteriota bacterium]
MEPQLSIGILEEAESLECEISGDFALADGRSIPSGCYRIVPYADGLTLMGEQMPIASDIAFDLMPQDASGSFTLSNVVIGKGFHWERREQQSFSGALHIRRSPTGRLTIINRVGLERYLESVISSEMSDQAAPEFLKAHAVISRSWVLAQLPHWRENRPEPPAVLPGSDEIVRWYDRENHDEFDVCADDHCQRYQGTAKAATKNARSAVEATYGMVLTFGGRLCDARFSKSCGGITERFSSAWANVEAPYLDVRYDGEALPPGFELPLRSEAASEQWILGRPPSFCAPPGAEVLSRILPGYDRETQDYYRWTARITQAELCALIVRKLGLDLGRVHSIEAVERGGSGRIVRLRLRGERRTVIIGKELEIRRALSVSHLYSSAFVIEREPASASIPDAFILRGAGWGHGVGLCQIGAAVMAEKGYDYRRILAWYFVGAVPERIY